MTAKNIFKTTLTLLLILTAATVLQAEPYKTSDSYEKIKTNFENSKLNKIEYDKNLTTVNGNISEINKAKTSVSKQKEQVTAEILKNNESVKKVNQQEREITQLISSEKEKLASEAKQLEQLDRLILQIKKNQDQRNILITEYQNQLALNQEAKKSWKDRETQLQAQQAKVTTLLRSLGTDESSWKSKQKGYEIEIKRWIAETEKQQKTFDTYQGLKDSK